MQVPLAPLTTLRLGGPAARFVVAKNEDEIVRTAREERVFVLGGGSNVVIADEGWNGTVLKIDSRGIREAGDEIEVEAGEPWDDLARAWTRSGRAGAECLVGIPGLVGATPMQNVGAYGQEVSGIITRVRAFDRRDDRVVEIDANDCGFGYRTSIFRGSDRFVITRVTFRMRERPDAIRYAELQRVLGEHAPLEKIGETVLALRRTKGMVLDENDPDTVSAGSFFTNPIVDASVADRVKLSCGHDPPRFPAPEGKVKLPAAWLIERAGFTKGHARGRARISTKHALALVNDGGTTRELLDLAREIRDGVLRSFEIRLEPEPILIGCAI